jgi:hemolysin activation/secretion protein
VPQGEPGEVIIDDVDEATHSPERNQILVENLTGLVFIGSPDDLVASGLTTSGIHFKDVVVPNESIFKETLNAYLGHALTLTLLDEVAYEVVKHYRTNDLAVVDALVPDGQDITEGVVQIAIITGKRGNVLVEGAQYFSKEQIQSGISIAMDEELSIKQLQADADWLNQNPFRRVDLFLQRGEEFAKSDIVLNVEDRFPLRAFAGVDDGGTELTGTQRWLAGFNWGNAFGLGHQFNYQYTSAFDRHDLMAHSMSYLAPLPWRHNLIVFGDYVESKPDLNNLFTLEGRNWQVGARYNIPLPKWNDIKHEVALGYDFKRSNNNLEFGGLTVTNTFTEISQFSINYTANRVDDWGNTSFDITAYISPGKMTGNNTDTNFNASRANASADYYYTNISLSRVTLLPYDFSWLVDLQLQLASDNLLGNEQLGIGGYHTVRGYDEYEVVGDEGFTARTEIRTPTWSVLDYLNIDAPDDEIQFLAFIDYGIVSNVDRLTGENSTDLISTGVGLRYSISPYLTFRADYGWQLEEVSDGVDKANRLHASLILAY